MRKIYIEATSLFLSDYDTPQSDIKNELQTLSGKSFRRINQYILLGLAGLFRLSNIAKTDKLTSLYIGTKMGCIRDTTEILHQIYKEKLLPMPFAFIAANSNMANYHIANTLGLANESYTISHDYSPFEMAFKMSLLDLFDCKSNSSIIGCIDETIPIEKGAKSGSYWMKLTTNPKMAIGTIRLYQEFATFNELLNTNISNMTIIANYNTKESMIMHASHCIWYKNIFDIFQILEKREHQTIALIFRLSKSKISLCIIDS